MNVDRSELVALYPYLTRYAIKLSKNTHDAEDLVQDTMYKAIAREESFEPGTSLKAWVGTILYHRFIDEIVYYSKRPYDTYGDDPPDVGSDGNELLVRCAFTEVMNVLASMPLEQRIVLEYLSQGLEYEEIAEICDIPIGTIRSRTSRGREKLYKHYPDGLHSIC